MSANLPKKKKKKKKKKKYNRGFGKTGCTARVDQDAHVATNQAGSGAVTCTHRRRPQHLGLHFRSEEENLEGTLAVAKVWRSKHVHLFLREIFPDLRIDQEQPGSGRLDGMHKRPSGQVVVDEGRDGADTPQTQPQKDKRRRIQEIHGDDFLWLDAVYSSQPVPIAQDGLVALAEGPRAPIIYDKGMVGGAGVEGVLFKHIEKVESSRSFGQIGPYDGEGEASGEADVVGQAVSRVQVGQRSSCSGNNRFSRDIWERALEKRAIRATWEVAPRGNGGIVWAVLNLAFLSSQVLCTAEKREKRPL